MMGGEYLRRIALALEKLAQIEDDRHSRVTTLVADRRSGREPNKNYQWGSAEYVAARAWADAHGASARVRRVIANAGITSFDDLTPDRLYGIHSCGPDTLARVLAWAAQKREQQQ